MLVAAKARGVKLGNYARISKANQEATTARAEAVRPAIASASPPQPPESPSTYGGLPNLGVDDDLARSGHRSSARFAEIRPTRSLQG